jgi:hypothetical protein
MALSLGNGSKRKDAVPQSTRGPPRASGQSGREPQHARHHPDGRVPLNRDPPLRHPYPTRPRALANGRAPYRRAPRETRRGPLGFAALRSWPLPTGRRRCRPDRVRDEEASLSIGSISPSCRRAATYADKLLKGASSRLPVERFEVAHAHRQPEDGGALGLTLPPSVLPGRRGAQVGAERSPQRRPTERPSSHWAAPDCLQRPPWSPRSAAAEPALGRDPRENGLTSYDLGPILGA